MSKVSVEGRHIRVPTMSPGIRSGVNWRRRKLPPMTSARVRTASVLATPGTPSRSRWPRASRPTSIRSIIRSWPTSTRLISNWVRSRSAATSAVSKSWVVVIFRHGSVLVLVVDTSPPRGAKLTRDGDPPGGPSVGPSVPGVGSRLDQLDEHAAGVLGVDEVDPGAGGAAAGLVVQQPQAALAQDGARPARRR